MEKLRYEGFGTLNRSLGDIAGEPTLLQSGEVGREESSTKSMLSKTEEDRKTEPGELGTLEGAKDVPLWFDCIDCLSDGVGIRIGGTLTDV